MEKSAAVTQYNRSRLLKRCAWLFACVLSVFSVSADVSQSYISSLEFSPSASYFFTDQECLFTLDITDVQPEDVQVFFDVSADNVQFISSRKSDLILNQNGVERIAGTSVQLRVQFSKPGTYTIPSVYVRIARREYRIPFARVTVYQNPQFITPELSVLFSNPKFDARSNSLSVVAGETVDFTVYVKYALQIVGYSWELPEDALFEELKRYDIKASSPRGTEFSPDAVPVATFRWRPLTEGEGTFPHIQLRATAYNGSLFDITTPQYSVSVVPASQVQSSVSLPPSESVFAYAFASPPVETLAPVSVGLTGESYKTLYSLRCAERWRFPLTSVTRARRALEVSAGLSPDGFEPSVPLFVLFCVLSVLFLAIAVVMFVFKKIPSGAVFIMLMVASAIPAAIEAAYVFSPGALFRGGELCSIPEENGSSGVEIPGGTRVKVKQSAGGWVYIQVAELKGWVEEDRIDFIR